MKVVVNTPDLLIARHQPVILPLLLTFLAVTLPIAAFTRAQSSGTRELIGVAVGTPLCLFGASLTNRSSHFRFEARKRQVKWSRKDAWKQAKGSLALDEIEGVLKESMLDTEGRSYRVALKTASGRIPLTAHYSTVEPHDATVSQIRAWLEHARNSKPS